MNVNGNLRVTGVTLDLKLEKLAEDPTGGGLQEGRLWFDDQTKIARLFNGTDTKNIGDVVFADLTAALVPYAQTTDVNTAISTAVGSLVTDTQLQSAIDNALAGLDFQADILGTESDFVSTAGRYSYVNGSKFTSGVAASAGDIVVVNGAGVIQSVAYDVSAKGPGALTWNRAAPNGGAWYRWDGTSWDLFGGLSGFTAGNGLQDSAGTISVKAADATIVVDGSGVKVGDLSGSYVTPSAQTSAISAALGSYDTSAQVTTKISNATASLATSASVTAVTDRLAGGWHTATTNSAATSHTITHAIGFRYPLVQVVDKATNKVIIPDEVEFTSLTQFVITLGVAADVIVSAIALKPAA